MKKLLAFLLVAVLALTAVNVASVSATDEVNNATLMGGIEIIDFAINDVDIDPFDANAIVESVELARAETMDIEFVIKAIGGDLEDVEIEARLFGYRYSSYELDKVIDIEGPFDLDQDTKKKKTLTLTIPKDLDFDKDVFLRIIIGDKSSPDLYNEDFRLNIEGIDRDAAVQVERVSFSPNIVQAGFGFTGLVQIKNYGDDDLDDVHVTMKVLGVPGAQDSENLDELDSDERETLEEFAIRIPEDTKPGVYDVEVEVEFDRYESTKYLTSIEITKGYASEEVVKPESRLIVNVPESLAVNAGSTVIYPVTLTNDGNKDATVVLSATNVQAFGTVTFNPGSVMVVKAGQTATATLSLTANEDASGVQNFILNIDVDGDKKQVTLNTVVNGGSNDLRRGLEIGLIVLVIILIILGLIVGFTRMKKGDDDETQTYY